MADTDWTAWSIGSSQATLLSFSSADLFFFLRGVTDGIPDHETPTPSLRSLSLSLLRLLFFVIFTKSRGRARATLQPVKVHVIVLLF